MAAQTKTDTGVDFEAAAERIQELNERILEASKKAGTTYVDAYEKTLKTIADFQERVGEASPVEWVTSLTNAQADLLRNFAEAYVGAARKALK
ncbi:MAG: hypothetical protein ACM3UV_04675 [Nocardioidaceae bacterium]